MHCRFTNRLTTHLEFESVSTGRVMRREMRLGLAAGLGAVLLVCVVLGGGRARTELYDGAGHDPTIPSPIQSYSSYGIREATADNDGMSGQLFCNSRNGDCGQRVQVGTSGLWKRAAQDVSRLGSPQPRTRLLREPEDGTPLWGHPSQPLLSGAHVHQEREREPENYRQTAREVGDDGEGERGGRGAASGWEGSTPASSSRVRAERGAGGGGGGGGGGGEGGKWGEIDRWRRMAEHKIAVAGQAFDSSPARPHGDQHWAKAAAHKRLQAKAASLSEVGKLEDALGRIEGEVGTLTEGMRHLQTSMTGITTARAHQSHAASSSNSIVEVPLNSQHQQQQQPGAGGHVVGQEVSPVADASRRVQQQQQQEQQQQEEEAHHSASPPRITMQSASSHPAVDSAGGGIRASVPFTGTLVVSGRGHGGAGGAGLMGEGRGASRANGPESLPTGGTLDEAGSGVIGMASPLWTRRVFPELPNGDSEGGVVGDIDHLTSDVSPRSAFARQLGTLASTQHLRPLSLHPGGAPLSIADEGRAMEKQRLGALLGGGQALRGHMRPLRWRENLQDKQDSVGAERREAQRAATRAVRYAQEGGQAALASVGGAKGGAGGGESLR